MKLEYQIKYRDILIFNLMHQFFSLPIQVFYGGLTALVFLQYLPTEDFATGFTEAILMYLLIWLSQFLFIVIYLLFGKNKGLYTRHILTVSDNDFCVETIFAKSHYYLIKIQTMRFINIFLKKQVHLVYISSSFIVRVHYVHSVSDEGRGRGRYGIIRV